MFVVTNKNKGPRACSTCAKAKSRCIAGPVSNVCERCHRLNKPCGLQTPAPARKRRLDGGLESARPERTAQNGASHGGGGDSGPHRGNPNAGNTHMANGRHSNGHQQSGSKPAQRTAAKSTRVAELERRLEDLTSRLESVSQQQKLHREINPPESDDPSHRTSPMDIFRLKAHWAYMYPARHIFPADSEDATPRPEHMGSDPKRGSVPQQPLAESHAGVSPPVTIIASPASNTSSGGSVLEGSSASAAQKTSSGAHRDKDDPHPASFTIPKFCMPGQRQHLRKAPTVEEAAAKGRNNIAADIAAIAASTATYQQRYYRQTGTSGEEGPATPASLPSLQSASLDPDNIWPQDSEAEVMLSKFRKYLTPLFPFVIIPDYVTSEQLRSGRPTLWKAVMMATCQLDGARQIVMGNQLLGELAAAAFLQPRRTLDMLQAVLVMIGWFHYNVNSFQLINFLYLARAMCVSLNISEPPPTQAAPLRQNHNKDGGGSGHLGDDRNPTGATNNAARNDAKDANRNSGTPRHQVPDYPPVVLEQMRTFAGTFYLTALSTTNKRTDLMMTTPYLETCCQVLERQKEYASDAYLVQLVRVQQLSQSISMAYSVRNDGVQMGPSLAHMVQNLRQQFESFKAQIPQAYSNDINLVGHLHTAEIILYEASLQEASSYQMLKGESLPANDRLEMLWACTRAIKNLVNNRFQHPMSDQPKFLCLTAFDFIHAFVTALKLMTLQAPGWDGRLVRSELAFDYMVDRQILDLHQLAARRRKCQFRISAEEPVTGKKAAEGALNVTALAGSSSSSSSGTPESTNGARNDNVASPDNNNSSGRNIKGARSAEPKDDQATANRQSDPFERLAERLTELKYMISKELDRLPGVGAGASSNAEFGRNLTSTMGSLSFPSTMESAARDAASDRMNTLGGVAFTRTSQAPFRDQPDSDTEMVNSSALNCDTFSTLGARAGINIATDITHQPQQPHQPHQTPPDEMQDALQGALQEALQEAPQEALFEGFSINAEPILSFADATIDYMHNIDGSVFPDGLNAPGWESYMDVNMGTPSYYDSWGQMSI